jgi:hypothetical protein
MNRYTTKKLSAKTHSKNVLKIGRVNGPSKMRRDSTAVEHLTYNPKVKGSNTAVTGTDKLAEGRITIKAIIAYLTISLSFAALSDRDGVNVIKRFFLRH